MTEPLTCPLRPTIVRSVEVVDAELRVLAAVRAGVVSCGGRPSWSGVDALLDERLALCAAVDS